VSEKSEGQGGKTPKFACSFKIVGADCFAMERIQVYPQYQMVPLETCTSVVVLQIAASLC